MNARVYVHFGMFGRQFYVGSTVHLDKRIEEHQDGRGANHTRKRLPVLLVYVEEYIKIGDTFRREKKIQGGRREKKEELINGDLHLLPGLAECKNETSYKLYRQIK